MKFWRTRLLLLGGATCLALALPASSQEAPESLLPPGFGDPGDQEPDQPTPPDQPPVPADQPSSDSPSSPSARPGRALPVEGLAEIDAEDLEGLEPGRPLNYFAIPEGTARPVDRVGLLDPEHLGFAENAFGDRRGAYLATLMQRLEGPLPSRWTTILLRRALMSRLVSPVGVNPVDWVAARATAALQIGDADGARLLIQAVDVEAYTPLMVQAAAQTALATADPAALCPIVEPARGIADNEAVWTLAEAMCAALEGEASRADALVDQARRQGGGGIDLRLAEKIVGAGAQTRRSVTIDWEGVDEITPWRFGLASSTGSEIPAALVAGSGPLISAYLARAPMVPLEQRVQAAWTAAAMGIFSSQSLTDIHSLLFDATDPAELAGTVGSQLRRAWAHRQPSERLEALRELWEGESPTDRYARLILTAGAATGLAPSADLIGDSHNLIASMLSAGFDRQAARWGSVVDGEGGDAAWALLAVGTPRGTVDVSAGRVESFAENDDSQGKRRSRALIAALAGLGYLASEDATAMASEAGFRLAGEGLWSSAIDQAARSRQPATVALLAAVGMQTSEWGGVPPSTLFRTLRALRTVGLEYEARMIAAEAMTRL